MGSQAGHELCVSFPLAFWLARPRLFDYVYSVDRAMGGAYRRAQPRQRGAYIPKLQLRRGVYIRKSTFSYLQEVGVHWQIDPI